MSKFDRMIQSLDSSDITLIRKAEAAGLTTFSQGVKSLYNDYDATVAEWNAALNPAPAEAPAVEEVEETVTVTVTFMSFDMEMTGQTSDDDIRDAVVYASQYEYDREDIDDEAVRARIDDTVRGLIRARDETFACARS